MTKIKSWIKRHRIKSSIIAALFISFVWFSPFFKATDPTNPLFVESLFRLRDYTWNVREFEDKVIPTLFPVGTSKEYVDLMLVNRGGAKEFDFTKTIVAGRYDYGFTPLNRLFSPSPWRIQVYYSGDNKVIAIRFGMKNPVGDIAKVPGIPRIKK